MTGRTGFASPVDIAGTIREVREFGGDVNQITTTPSIRQAMLEAAGGNPDGELHVMGIPVVADASHPAFTISLTWYEA